MLLRPVVSSTRGEAPGQALAGVRVFLAEDGADHQGLIAFHLRKSGADVVVFCNGKAAIEAMTSDGTSSGPLRSEPACDVVLTDMQMPEMDGYTLASTLRAKGWTRRIMALTAHAMSGDAEKCLAAGCDAYASKPIERECLVDMCLGRQCPGAKVPVVS